MTKEEILATVNAITLELDRLLQDDLLEDHTIINQARILEVRQLINAITINMIRTYQTPSLLVSTGRVNSDTRNF